MNLLDALTLLVVNGASQFGYDLREKTLRILALDQAELGMVAVALDLPEPEHVVHAPLGLPEANVWRTSRALEDGTTVSAITTVIIPRRF